MTVMTFNAYKRSPFQDESAALFARMSTPPSSARKLAINDLIVALKAAGVWSKLDVLQIYAAADSQAALLNWVSSSYNASVVSAPTFTADYGYTTNGSSSYINTGFAPSTSSLSSQNDASMMLSNLKARQRPLSFVVSGGNQTVLYCPADAAFQGAANVSSAGADTLSVAETIHYMGVDRTGSSASKIYGREEISSTFTRASTGRPTINVFIGAMNNAGTPALYAAHDFCAWAHGKSLGDAGHLALQNALAVYMHSIGAWKRPLACWGDSRTQGATQTPFPTQVRTDSSNRRITYNGGVSGETSTQIKARFIADTTRISKDWVPVIWAGYNNISSPSTVLSDIAAMVSHCNTYYGGRYLVLNIPASRNSSFYPGTTNGDNIATINASLASTYGARMVDVCTPLYAGDPNSVVAAAYVIDVVTDYVHFNTAGLALVASAVETAAAAQGW